MASMWCVKNVMPQCQVMLRTRVGVVRLDVIRNKSAAVASVEIEKPVDFVGEPKKAVSKSVDPAFAKVDVQFENAREAYKSKSNGQLLRALLVLNLCSVKTLVENNKQVKQKEFVFILFAYTRINNETRLSVGDVSVL